MSASGYNDSMQEINEECIPGDYYDQDKRELPKKACPFKRTSLSLCSGLSDTNFGYQEGKPCVLLKMNRVTPVLSHRWDQIEALCTSIEMCRVFLFSTLLLFSTYLSVC